MAQQKFGGSTSFTDAHDTIQGLAGNAKWLSEYVPVGEGRITEVMLWLCHSVGLCCTIVGEYTMYRAGKLASRPDTLSLYIASPQTRSSEIDVFLQEQPSTNYAWGCRVRIRPAKDRTRYSSALYYQARRGRNYNLHFDYK